MKCKTCGYRLWQLPARRCPECGAEYRPSDYEFVPNSVQFCCPHCEQPYYGTGPMGHLVPTAFNCVSCGRHIAMDEMILRPAPGVGEDQTQVCRLPWMERAKRGWFRGWLGTVRMALLSPARMMREVPPDSPGWEAYGFTFLNTMLPILVAAVPVMVMMLLVSVISSPRGVPLFIPLILVIEFAVIGLICLLGAAIWALVVHLLLRITGRTAGPLLRTQQAIYYSSGANLVTAVPCFGPYVGWIWWVVSAIFAVKEGQRVHGGRAAFAVLGLPLGIMLLSFGLFFTVLSFANTMTFSSPSATVTASSSTSDTLKVTRSVIGFAQQHNGRGPQHAILLVIEGDLFASDFIDGDSNTPLNRIPLGTTTLEYFNFAKPSEQTRLARAAVAALPEGCVAHRLGDYVFTYQGMNLDNADPRLWVVVRISDPGANGGPSPQTSIVYGLANGTAVSSPATMFPSDLKLQNLLRNKFGLPPLPDLMTVTHTQPAVSGPAEVPE